MKAMKVMAVLIGVAGLAMTAQADMFVWDGGAGTVNFGDADNWDPDGSTFTAADEYQITDGSSVTVGSSYSIGAFDLSNGSALTVGSGNTLTVNTSNNTDLNTATLTVDGTLDFGSARWDVGGVGNDFSCTVNGTLNSSGNFYAGYRMNAEIEVNGTVDMKVTRLGGSLSSGVVRKSV